MNVDITQFDSLAELPDGFQSCECGKIAGPCPEGQSLRCTNCAAEEERIINIQKMITIYEKRGDTVQATRARARLVELTNT